MLMVGEAVGDWCCCALAHSREIFLCADESTNTDSFTISRDVLKGLYTLALANLNRDSSCLNTVYTVEKIVGNDPSFRMIRRTLGSPKKRYFGMHNLKNW